MTTYTIDEYYLRRYKKPYTQWVVEFQKESTEYTYYKLMPLLIKEYKRYCKKNNFQFEEPPLYYYSDTNQVRFK
jgi:hypothetical protein